MLNRRHFLGAAASAAFAQDDVIKVDVELVNILFNARDKKGGLVGDLSKDDIEIYEDGKLQEIRAFSRDANLPLTIGLLVDVSKSQESLIEVERRAAAAFFREVLRERDMAFLISFGSEAELLQDLTSSPRILTQALQQLRVNVDVGAYASGPVPSSRAQLAPPARHHPV